MDTSCSYRVGSLALLSPPFEVEPVLDETPSWATSTEFRKAVSTTLKDANVHVYHHWVVQQFRPGHDTKDAPLTLSIESDISLEGQYACWKTGFEKLRHLLDATGLKEMLIEIIDRKATDVRFRPFYTFPLLDVHSDAFLAVDTVMREFGVKHPFKIPTIVITARDAEDTIWKQDIIPRLRGSLPPGMDIDILYASALSWEPSESSEHSDTPLIAQRPGEESMYGTIMDNYSKVVRMGASVGLEEPANSTHSATVGAEIILRDSTGYETICGLTSNHVLAKNSGLICQNHPNGQYLSPDHQLCREGRASAKYMVDGPIYAQGKECLEKSSAQYALLNANPDRHFGTVWATSGFRIGDCTGCSHTRELESLTAAMAKDANSFNTETQGHKLGFGLDWALIKLDANRELSWKIPLYSKLRFTYLHITQFTHIQENKSYKVAKKGRTTGWTSGTISQIGSIVKLRPDNTNAVPADLRDQFGDATIVRAFSILHDDKREDFMKGGDSGSCVLLNEASDKPNFVGLLFASNPCTRASYMIPMDLVIRDIEHVTGQTVTQPTFVEYADRFD
ncbi:hypothetical protein yc1106_06520 [Curvularia clavata]|uniref:Uncharacterized protein n=1 Tax=Curvularia clavata TaxID=95742 RepID=A0A9Q8ZBN2_CURCL|nr:hypothetical protein yc1106_06520 [Curvularia clavata]